ncbi:MAG: DNA-directed RNA polymerase subunit beta' [Sphaerochaetaceae bacterium]|nr:DNA-directed RNA polymerase subunit beta' [Sphaerochaetaceae bacterium]MDD4396958.1 DNA-directed RNA polymerase subunit beta' [Sphaerochaetaceae bacterium]
MKEIQDFDSVRIKLASPEQIKAWSYGEVKKPETINYRTLRPERDGLFCEKIFGTTKEWECFCGKFKSIRYRGVVCDRCGVEVTNTKVRRERMGHITLASPVSHIWYYRSTPSKMSLLLDIPKTALQSVLYYEKYIVLNHGETDLKDRQLLTEDEYIQDREMYGEGFSAMMGAEAIRILLQNLDLDKVAEELRETMRAKGDKIDKRVLKRLEVCENFRNSGNKPEWMILTVIPVIPPDLRPMVQLDGGRFATSDLNDLYRRVINRNNRLNRLINLHAPDIIIRNEKRMLQDAVDALFDNSKRKKNAVKGANNRPLKSLSDMLKGKQGRFRQNLLGKRVDYSGRSVIVVGPELRLHQCGLPSKMALELYKPFIMKKLIQNGTVSNIKKAKSLVEDETNEVWSILDDVVREHPVMLNRAPTLHRLGIQAFEPVLVDGKAIKLHPLVCHAYNADFDGDQMAIHVPLTQAAQMECWTLMLSTTNLLDPANGKPVVFPGQDMILGINYLTRVKEDDIGQGKYFESFSEVLMAIEAGSLSYNAKIGYKFEDGKRFTYPKDPEDYTTAGRLIFFDVLPKTDAIGFDMINKCFGDKELKKLIGYALKTCPNSVVVKLLDSIKDIGFKYATVFGATIGLSDMIVPACKKEIVDAANKEQNEILDQFKQGHITKEERYNRLIDIWTVANSKLSDKLMDELRKSQRGFNPLFLMADSGARGSQTQIRQLGGMRGLMSRPNGAIIEFPIKSNFKEGLSIMEFFISTNGARKGLSDTALKTAEAGYLTRRLVDISQDVVVNEEDCGTINGIYRGAVMKGDEVLVSLSDRIVGYYTLEPVCHPITGEVILGVDQEISDEKAKEIEDAGVQQVFVRTVLTCEAKHGVCRKCYGRNLATNKTVDIGEAVGTIAAESIGQPGTQLTMRTFHVGGTATTGAEENKLVFKHPIFVENIFGNIVTREADGVRVFTRKGKLIYSNVLDSIDVENGVEAKVADGDRIPGFTVYATKDGQEIKCNKMGGRIKFVGKKLLVLSSDFRADIRNGSELQVNIGDYVAADDPVVVFDPFFEPFISEFDGLIEYRDLTKGLTYADEVNQETGKVIHKTIRHNTENIEPSLYVIDKDGNDLAGYHLPADAYIQVEDGEMVTKGEVLARLPKSGAKSNDITGGLPRVGDLFEARKPKNVSVLAVVDGTVKFGPIVKGKRTIIVTDEFGREFKHLVPTSKNVLVRPGDAVEAGDPLCDGTPDPHDILEICGENALQTYLVKEIQSVYRDQGVDINDKHIGIVIRQMLRKVQVLSVGDTSFILGQKVDKYRFHEENRRVLADGGQPAIARPYLLGITNASLSIDSFVSAASFQETTKVLTNAAIAGSKDELRGLKENVVIGHLIPAGTGMKRYRNVKLREEELYDQNNQNNADDVMAKRHHHDDDYEDDEEDRFGDEPVDEQQGFDEDEEDELPEVESDDNVDDVDDKE